jgi:acyl dehydratase
MSTSLAVPATRQYPELSPELIAEARSLIGIPLRRRPHYSVATREVLLRWSKALGSRNPLYADPVYGALNTPWATQVGHPTAIFAFDDTVVAPKLAGIHTIYAGVSIGWERQLRAGDTLRAEATLTAVEERMGRFCGPMILQTGEVQYTDGDGRPVAVARPRIMRTPRDAARRHGKYAGLTRHRYRPEEMRRILKAYEDEVVRGDVPRYVEDVQEGDELPPVVKGPLTTEDMNFFVGEVSETRAFREFLAHARRHPADVYWHEDKAMPDSWDASLLLDKVAHEFGFPCAHDTGLQRVAWMEMLVTNWMGDIAMLRSIDVRLDVPFLHADTAWLTGRVTETAISDRRAYAVLSLMCANQRGEAVATGTAVVELPSRSFDVLQPGLVVG